MTAPPLASLAAEIRTLAAPAGIGSLPTAAGQEDHVERVYRRIRRVAGPVLRDRETTLDIQRLGALIASGELASLL